MTGASFTTASIHRGGLHIRYPKSAIGRRLVLELWFGLYGTIWTARLRHRVDTVVVVTPPGLFVMILRMFLPRTVRLLCIVHDLQGIMAMSTENWLRRTVGKVVGAVERRMVAACDKVICLSESMRQAIVTRYGIAGDKCEVHYPFPTLSGGAEGRNDLANSFPQGFHHVVYAGALGEKQRPRELVDFFGRLCRKRSNIMCHIFSAGPDFEQVRREVQRRGVDRLFLRDLVPDENLSELYERSTVHVVSQAPGTEAGAFPSKIPNLLSAAVPIFAICGSGSELAKILTESKLGLSVHNQNLDIWVEFMEQLLDQIKHTPRQLARGYVRDKFNPDRLIAAILCQDS